MQRTLFKMEPILKKTISLTLLVIAAYSLVSIIESYATDKNTPGPNMTGPAVPYPMHARCIWDSDFNTGIDTGGSGSEDTLQFYTNGVEWMTIDPDGKVMITDKFIPETPRSNFDCRLEVYAFPNTESAVYATNTGDTSGELGNVNHGVKAYSSLGAAVYGYGSCFAPGGHFKNDGMGDSSKALYVEQTAASDYAVYSEGGLNFFEKEVGIGTDKPVTTLDVEGGMATRIITTSEPAYHPAATDYTILAAGQPNGARHDPVTVMLPPADESEGRILVIKDILFGDTKIEGNENETIDGVLTLLFSMPYESYTIQSNGVDWFILAHYQP